VNSSTPATWRGFGESLSQRYARSTWRLPLVCIVLAIAVFVPMYLVRGMRLVQLGAAGLVALAGGAVLFAHPFPAFLLALFILYSGVDLFLPGPVGTAILGVALARIAFDRWPPRLGGGVDWGSTSFRFALAGLLASAVTSLLVVWRWDNALSEVRGFGFGIAVFIAISALADRPSRVTHVLLVLALATVTTALPLFRALLSPGGVVLVAVAPEARFGGMGYDSNMLATAANCVLPSLCYLVTRNRGWRRVALLFGVLLLVVEVLLSHSRAGMAVLGLLALVLLGMVARRRPWIPVVVVVLVASALTWMPSMYWVRFASIGQLGGIVVDRSLLLRTHLLQGAWQTFMDHFWIGVGLGNFRNTAPTFILGSWVAHNGFLEVGATLGIMGLVSYVVMLASGANMAWRAARPWGAHDATVDRGLALGIFLALGAFCLGIMTLSSHFHVLFWILLGLANAVRRCAGGTSRP